MIVAVAGMLIATALGLQIALIRPRDFVLFLLPVSILRFGAEVEGAGGLANLSAIWLLLLIGVCAVAMLRIGSSGFRLNGPEIFYLLFLGWCALEFARAQDHSYAARSLLRLSFPFMSMFLARRTLLDSVQADKLIKRQYLGTSCGSAVAWVMLAAPVIFFHLTEIVWYGAVFLDQCAIVAFLGLANFRVRRRFLSLIFALLQVLLCFVAVNRTTLIALAVGVSMFCLLEFRKLSIILLPALYMTLGAIILLVPSVRDKMFHHPGKVKSTVVLTTDVLTNKEFNDDGRYAMWTEILNRFFWPNPVAGAGLGSTQAWFYNGGAEKVLHSRLKVEHCEYIKLAADTGVVGLSLFLIMQASAFCLAINAHRRARTDTAKVFALAAACSLPVFWVCMAFDNALLYALPVAQFPTAFAAIASSLSRQQPQVSPVYKSVGRVDILWLARRRVSPGTALVRRVTEI